MKMCTTAGLFAKGRPAQVRPIKKVNPQPAIEVRNNAATRWSGLGYQDGNTYTTGGRRWTAAIVSSAIKTVLGLSGKKVKADLEDNML